MSEQFYSARQYLDDPVPTYRLPPQDPTRPPSTKNLLYEARRASARNVKINEEHDHHVNDDEHSKEWTNDAAEEDDEEDPQMRKNGVPANIDVVSNLSTEGYSYISPIAPRENVVDLDTMKVRQNYEQKCDNHFILSG